MLQTVLDHLDKIVRPAIRDYVAAEEALDTAHAANDPAATPALDPPTRGQARRYPESWQPQAGFIDWRDRQLRAGRANRRSGNHFNTGDPPPVGRNTINFLSGGSVKRFASSSGRRRAA